jgi:hypothetical protein
MGRFHPPEFDKGDPNTIGGYIAVHGRPPAFEGSDGSAYSGDIMVDEIADAERPFAGYLFFVQWRPNDPVAVGHLETDYLVWKMSEESARAELGRTSLSEVKLILDQLIVARAAREKEGERPWWEAMKDDDHDD